MLHDHMAAAVTFTPTGHTGALFYVQHIRCDLYLYVHQISPYSEIHKHQRTTELQSFNAICRVPYRIHMSFAGAMYIHVVLFRVECLVWTW